MLVTWFSGEFPVWTNKTLAHFDCINLDYPGGGLTGGEWPIIGPLIPPAKRGGNKREIVKGLIYTPAPAASDGVVDEVACARNGEWLFTPLGDIDDQSVESAGKKRAASARRAITLARRSKKERRVPVGIQSLLPCAMAHAVDVQACDSGTLLMSALSGPLPFLLKPYADSGYGGQNFKQALARVCHQVDVEIVKQSPIGKFVVQHDL